MNKTIQSLTKTDYASPLCKTIAVNVNTVLCGSKDGIDDISGSDNVKDQSGNWGVGF